MSNPVVELPVGLKSKVLRLAIDGRWAAADFQDLFGAADTSYRFFALAEAERSSLLIPDIDLHETTRELDLHLQALISAGPSEPEGPLPVFATLADAIRADTTLQHFQVAERLEFYGSFLRNLALTDRRDHITDLDSAVYATRSRRFLARVILRREHAGMLVRRCRYASPGITDFAGVAQTLGHVKDLVLQLLARRDARNERAIREELLNEELRLARFKNIEQQIALLKSVGYTDFQCRKILSELSDSVGMLGALVQRGLVQQVELVDDDDG